MTTIWKAAKEDAAVELNKELAKDKIVLGMSGGVDSTAACLLLQKAGYHVTGLYFDVTGDGGERTLAEKTAEKLGIDLIYRDVSKEFSEIVIRDFVECYTSGRTPNPCIVCNPSIKFKVLTDAADEIGAYHIATGHYAKVINEGENWYIGRASNPSKDQSYMLYRLNKETVSRLVLPLSDVEDKQDLRDMLKRSGLENAEARDSQEICFIDDETGYKQYLKDNSSKYGCELPPESGNFVDTSGQVIGEHGGIINYTVGQRKGLGVTFGKPMYVTDIKAELNEVILGEIEDLFDKKLLSVNNTFFNENEKNLLEKGKRIEVLAKIRYLAKPAKATVSKADDEKLLVEFDEKQKSITSGQSVVFYDSETGNKVLGGGFIE